MYEYNRELQWKLMNDWTALDFPSTFLGLVTLSVPKFTANLYCICLSIPQIYKSILHLLKFTANLYLSLYFVVNFWTLSIFPGIRIMNSQLFNFCIFSFFLYFTSFQIVFMLYDRFKFLILCFIFKQRRIYMQKSIQIMV